MIDLNPNPAILYLSLLTNPQPEVQRQACAIFLGTYGDHALTYVRRLLNMPDPHVCSQARAALHAIAEYSGHDVKMQPLSGLYIACLGILRVYMGNHTVQQQDWMQYDSGRAGWQKMQAVLAYLIHSGRRGASRKTLEEIVWGGKASATSLSRTLTVLRQTLASMSDEAFAERVLTITKDHCILAPDLYHTDVQLFERTCEVASQVEETQGLEAATPLYTQALLLYNGPYMADIPQSRTWCQPQRDFLTNSFIIIIERLAEYAYTRQRYQQCVQLCMQGLNFEETADDLVVWVLRAYQRMNRRSDMEYIYRHYLRAAAIYPHSPEGQQDAVVQVYQRLAQTREALINKNSREYSMETYANNT